MSNDSPLLSKEELAEIEQTFNQFSEKNTNTMNPKELKEAMESLGFDKESPTIYQIVVDITNSELGKGKGITLEQFKKAITDKLGDLKTKEGIKRVFDLFIDNPNQNAINLETLKKITKDLGDNMRDDELQDMLKHACKDETNLTFDEFYDIMTKKFLS